MFVVMNDWISLEKKNFSSLVSDPRKTDQQQIIDDEAEIPATHSELGIIIGRHTYLNLSLTLKLHYIW